MQNAGIGTTEKIAWSWLATIQRVRQFAEAVAFGWTRVGDSLG